MSTYYYDLFVKYRQDDLLKEAENERLLNQLTQASRIPLRVRVANSLRVAAQWLDGTPQLANA